MEFTAPARSYPDWFRGALEVEMDFKGYGNWWYYYFTDWENVLLYCVVLATKGYIFDGDMPHWLQQYMNNMRVVPFRPESREITMSFSKKGWITNTLTYLVGHRERAPRGLLYNVRSQIVAQQGFLDGQPDSFCPEQVWGPYARRREENLRTGKTWAPEQAMARAQTGKQYTTT